MINLLKKNEKMEDIIESNIDYIKKLNIQIKQIDRRLNTIDEKGYFKTDDETGWIFSEIKKMGEQLNKFKIDE
jgi:uncharacterized protein YaaN involved in tellurite resistance